MTRITPYTIKRFTEGDCHFLARALSQITGYPMAALLGKRFQNTPDLHCFLPIPSGWDREDYRSHPTDILARPQPIWTDVEFGLDVHGIRPIAEMREEYYAVGWDFTTWREIIEADWGGPHYGPYTYARAKQLAKYLVDKYLRT
jgi:hypothetical protein